MRSVGPTVLVALAALLLTPPRSATAQIGGLVRKAQNAASGKSTSGQDAKIVVPAEIQITPAKLDQFERGLSAMQAHLDSSRKIIASVKSPDAYSACSQGYILPSQPEVAKIQANYMAAMRALAQTNPTGPQMQAGATKAQNDMMNARTALVTSHCGPDPRDVGESQSSRYVQEAQAAGEKASGMTHDAWLMIMERVPPYCELSADKRGSGDVRAQGQNVYLASESRALAPRCAALMPRMHATIN